MIHRETLLQHVVLFGNLVLLCSGGGNQFVTEGGAVQLTHGVHCTKTTASPPVYTVTLTVFERDFHFRDDDGNIEHFTCLLGDTDSARADNDRVTPSTDAACGNSRWFSTVDHQSSTTTGPIDRSQQRTHQKIITVDTDLGSLSANQDIECGGRWNDAANDMEFSAFCYREVNMDHEHDRAFYFEIDTDDCILEVYDTDDVEIDNPSETVVNVDYVLSLDVYAMPDTSRNPFTAVTTEKSTSPITTSIALGTAIYVEACIDIDDKRLYFVNQHSILGLFVHDCVAKPHTDGNSFFNSPSDVGVSDSDGCGNNNSPMRAWETSNKQFRFAKGGTDANMPWFSSPNCFRSDAFEAVSFSRLEIDEPSTVMLECSVDYCTDIQDANCFGTVDLAMTFPGDNYEQCPSARKRRSADSSVPANLPRRLSFNYTVYTQFETDDSNQGYVSDGCFEQTAFIGLSGFMALLIVIVLCIDVVLGIKLSQRKERDESPSGSSYGTDSSTAGIQNKAFY